MNGFRFFRLSVAAVIVALACVPIISAQEDTEKPTNRSTCKVFSLADLGNDPELCTWIAETIPQMIQPESWRRWEGSPTEQTLNNKKNTLSYYAPAKVLVVYHTPAVHGQIDEFLQNLKKAMPAQKAAKHTRPDFDPQAVQAQFTPPAPPPMPPPFQGSYPVPMRPTQPKHLFHFIIRYEGDGIIDQNVVRFTKAMTDAAKAPTNSAEVAPPPVSQSGYSMPPSQGAPLRAFEDASLPAAGPTLPRSMPPVDGPPPPPQRDRPLPPPPPPLPF